MTETYVIGDREYRDWPAAAVLAAVTNREVCDRKTLYSLHAWMHGGDEDALEPSDVPLAIGLGLVNPAVKAELLRQFPRLQDAVDEAVNVDADNWEDWLTRWVGRYGTFFPVSRVLQ